MPGMSHDPERRPESKGGEEVIDKGDFVGVCFNSSGKVEVRSAGTFEETADAYLLQETMDRRALDLAGVETPADAFRALRGDAGASRPQVGSTAAYRAAWQRIFGSAEAEEN